MKRLSYLVCLMVLVGVFVFFFMVGIKFTDGVGCYIKESARIV